jgi:transposase
MRFISYQPNWQEQLLEVLLLFEIYKNGEMIKRIYDASTIAMISKREIALLLEKTGFKIDNIYGDYNKSKNAGNQMVIEARKA